MKKNLGGASSLLQFGLRTSVLNHIRRGDIRAGTVQGAAALMVPARGTLNLGFSRYCRTQYNSSSFRFPSTLVAS